MNADMKARLAAKCVSELGFPLAREAISHRYEKKRMEKRKELSIEEARQKRKKFQSLGQAGGSTHQPQGDVYQELEQLRSRTDCSFCHEVISQLKEAPEEDASEGYAELRQYIDAMEHSDGLSREEAEHKVQEIVDNWVIVPKYVTGR